MSPLKPSKPLIPTKKPPKIRGPFMGINRALMSVANADPNAVGVYTGHARRRRTHGTHGG